MSHQPIPGPAPIKNPLEVVRMMGRFNHDVLGELKRLFTTYGNTTAIRVGKFMQILSADPQVMREVLVTKSQHFAKDSDYTDPKRGIARFAGTGLLTSNGDFWKRQRKLVAPSLHAKRIEAYAETMVTYAAQLTTTWHDQMRLDVSQAMNALTIQIVSKTLFDLDIHHGIVAQAGEIMQAIQRFTGEKTMLPTWIPTPREMQARRALRLVDEMIYGFIHQYRAHGQDKGDLLSMLILAENEDNERMSDKQVRDEAMTLFFAGHETTANALNWTWYLLALNPEAEAKLHHELDTVLGGALPTLADLKRLPYTEMVMKESMRLYPPAWGVSRVALSDVEIADYFFPKGATVGLSFYYMHRDAHYWDDPERFIPERFDETQEASARDRYTYLPFGAGPRVCIGNSFAMMEAQLVLATIAQRYQLRLTHDQVVEPLALLTLNPRGGLPMTITQRQPIAAPNIAMS